MSLDFRYNPRVPATATAPLLRDLARIPSWVRWLAVLSAARLAVAATLPLLTDEAYHWNFARHLDWGYYDHPPMIAWAIAGGRLLFGDTPLGVRFLPVLFSTGTAAVLAMIAGRAYGDRAAGWTILLGFAQPLLFGVTASATPDSPMLFFWAATLGCAWRAIESGKPRWWLAAGLALGGAMLSKYSAILIVPSVFGYLLCSREHRRVLATPWPYLAVGLASLAFLPVVSWNAAHGWASFQFQLVRRLDQARRFSPLGGVGFFAQQWACFLPLLMPLAAAWVARAVRSKRNDERFLLWCASLTIAVFLALAFTRKVNSNWPVPAYLALCVGMAGAAVGGDGRVARFYGARPALLLLVMGIAYAAAAPFAVARAVRVQPDLFAWKEVCREAVQLRSGMGNRTFYLGLGRNFVAASQLAFHLRAPELVFARNLLGDEGMQYDYWVDPKALTGWDAVVVMEEKEFSEAMLARLRQRFGSVEAPRELRVPVPVYGAADLKFYLARAERYAPP